MRKQYILFIIITFLLSTNAWAQHEEYSGKIHVTPLSLQQMGDSVYLRIDFDISGVNVDSRKSISLIPALVAQDKRLYLPEVMVKGREDFNVYKREMSLMSKRELSRYNQKAPYAVLKGFKSDSSRKLAYDWVIKYESWMADAKLDIYEDLCGCGNPPRRMGVSQLVNFVGLEKARVADYYEMLPAFAYIKPEVESVKHRNITGESYLDFVVNQWQIRPEYMNNPTELRKIADLVLEVKNDPTIEVKSISVEGYASPEGKIANNQMLSENRAKSLVEFLFVKFDYPRSIYTVKFGGENWNGLKQKVEASDMPYRQQVLDIIESVPAEINYVTNTSRKKALMDLAGGVPYRYMLREFFPSLRKAVCRIDFDVKNFDVDQAKEVMKTRPQNLSLNEMFLVANSYEKGAPEFIDLFETAVKLFPNNMIANLNAATAALERKDLISAEKYLTKVDAETEVPEYYNTKAILYMFKGDLNNAEDYFQKAAEKGLSEARRNLNEMTNQRNFNNMMKK